VDKAAQEAQKRYQEKVKRLEPRPRIARDLFRAFLTGGILSIIGQGFFDAFSRIEPSEGEAVAATLAAMIFLGALLTALGVYDEIAEFAGAGAAVPITGFANTVVAAAMDFRREGFILGLGCKMFLIAGPILVWGTVAGFFAGLLKIAVLSLLR